MAPLREPAEIRAVSLLLDLAEAAWWPADWISTAATCPECEHRRGTHSGGCKLGQFVAVFRNAAKELNHSVLRDLRTS